MDRSADDVGTELVDLSDLPLAELRTDNSQALAHSIDRILKQTERPRTNLGGAGPPGRAD